MNSLGQLRDICDNELNLMLSWRNAPEVRANMYTQHEISDAEHFAWWARTRQREDQKYFMYERGGQPLGIVGFMLIDRVNSNCSWAFYAGPSAPKGTGSRMEFLALDYIFTTMKLYKLHCEVLAFNTAVIRLHQKFGFQVEGVLRQHHFVGNEYIDTYKLGILAHEWAVKRDEIFGKLNSSKRS